MMRSLSSRVAVAGVVVTALLLGLVGATAFVLMRDQLRANLAEAAAHAAEIEGRHLATVMAGVVAHLQETATNSLIANALTDTVGRHAYVDPFLRGIRSVQGVPVSVQMTDFLGRHMTGGPGADRFGEEVAIAVRAIEQQQSVSVLTGDEVLLAAPVIYAATGTAEGALIYSIPRDALAVPRPDGTLIDSITATLYDTPSSIDPPVKGVLEGRFLFDLGNGLHLKVRALASVAALETPETRLLGMFALAGVVCLGLAVVGSYALTNVLTRHLRRLKVDMARVVATASFAERLKVVNQDEVGSLAQSFNMVLDKLEKAHDEISEHAEQRLNDSEARYRMLAEHASDVISRMTHDGTIRYASPAVHRVLGCSPTDVTGRRLADFAHPDDRGAVEAMLAATAADSHGEVSFWAQRPNGKLDGKDVWLDASAHRVGDAADGDLVTILRDVTRRKMAEDQLAAKTKDLERSNAELEQFAYVASHDLRQPLRMINSFTQLLERGLDGTLTPDHQEYLGYVRDGATRMDHMLVALLEYSRVGRQGEPIEPVSSRALAEEAITYLSPQIAESHGEVHLHGDWPTIMASPNEGVRLFQNLIGNALKYRAPDRAPVIDIFVHPIGSVWEFTIKDNGIGIDPRQTNRLFKVFQRLQTNGQFEGTGIGLAVCRKIVERHGGAIGVESEGDGKGSTFRFTLP